MHSDSQQVTVDYEVLFLGEAMLHPKEKSSPTPVKSISLQNEGDLSPLGSRDYAQESLLSHPEKHESTEGNAAAEKQLTPQDRELHSVKNQRESNLHLTVSFRLHFEWAIWS